MRVHRAVASVIPVPSLHVCTYIVPLLLWFPMLHDVGRFRFIHILAVLSNAHGLPRRISRWRYASYAAPANPNQTNNKNGDGARVLIL